MITHYRNKALKELGLGLLMFALCVVMLILKKLGIPTVLVVIGGILLATAGLVLYLRGCVHLAEAKGHSGGVVPAAIIISSFCLPGIIFLLPLVLAVALDDKNKRSTEGGHSRHHRHKRSYHHGHGQERGHAHDQKELALQAVHTKRHRRRHHHGHDSGSHIERVMRYRRNAVLGVYLGVLGIALGVFVSIFRLRIFLDHSNEIVLGITIFAGGYCAVLTGCGWWLKAKSLNEAIVFIGLMPLAVPFVPFVRLILFANPSLLLVSMVMMPLILVVVVFTLPDQSGLSRRKRMRWEEPGEIPNPNPQSRSTPGLDAAPRTE